MAQAISLEELANFAGRNGRLEHMVIPVFHVVHPFEVPNQSGAYWQAFAQHKEELIENLQVFSCVDSGQLQKIIEQENCNEEEKESKNIKTGDGVPVKAIEESISSIIIFGKNFASSTWGRSRLVKVHECIGQSSIIVRPVFNAVDPSELRKQSEVYDQAFGRGFGIGNSGDWICSSSYLLKHNFWGWRGLALLDPFRAWVTCTYFTSFGLVFEMKSYCVCNSEINVLAWLALHKMIAGLTQRLDDEQNHAKTWNSMQILGSPVPEWFGKKAKLNKIREEPAEYMVRGIGGLGKIEVLHYIFGIKILLEMVAMVYGRHSTYHKKIRRHIMYSEESDVFRTSYLLAKRKQEKKLVVIPYVPWGRLDDSGRARIAQSGDGHILILYRIDGKMRTMRSTFGNKSPFELKPILISKYLMSLTSSEILSSDSLVMLPDLANLKVLDLAGCKGLVTRKEVNCHPNQRDMRGTCAGDLVKVVMTDSQVKKLLRVFQSQNEKLHFQMNNNLGENVLEQMKTIGSRFSVVSKSGVKIEIYSWGLGGHTSFPLTEPVKSLPCDTQTCFQKNKRKEIVRRVSSFMATLTFLVCLFSTKFNQPLLKGQDSHSPSFQLALLAMLNFIALACAVCTMILVGARVTGMQITIVLISVMALSIGNSDPIVIILVYVPLLAILFSGCYARAKGSLACT